MPGRKKSIPRCRFTRSYLASEITARLAPLGMVAESASGLFGGLKIPGFGGGIQSKPPPVETTSSEPDPGKIKKTATRKRTAKTPVARKKTAERKKTAAKKK